MDAREKMLVQKDEELQTLQEKLLVDRASLEKEQNNLKSEIEEHKNMIGQKAKEIEEQEVSQNRRLM